MKTLAALVLSLFLTAPAFAADFQIVGKNEKRIESGKYDRVISVYAPELDWDGMKKFAQAQAWDGPGTMTTVCFFDDRVNTPDVTFSGIDFSETYKDHWIAAYYHRPDEAELFIRDPGKKRTIAFSNY
ncbi:MAG TPA: hypothetical protein VL688_01790 [Verrucomicrobiae bacterium]|jgi:hypothetical protein|nr:hypothetical protein [Verrucomicrobiae bacterium]